MKLKRNKGKEEKKRQAISSDIWWELFFEKLLQNIDAFVMVTDSKGYVVFANTRYLNFFHLKDKDVVGKSWIDNIVSQPNRELVKEIFDNIKRKRTLGRFETPLSILNKDEKCASWIEVPLKEDHTYFYMFMGWEGRCSDGFKVKVHAAIPKELNTPYREVVAALFTASHVTEPTTAEHALRVMSFAAALAKKLRLSNLRIERLKVACLLHDLGKIAIDEKILFKKGKLTKKEFDEIKKHPEWGSQIAHRMYFLNHIIPIMADHHENYDGSGYPKGTKGEKIPLEARILSVADIYEALTADRPYRNGFSQKKAVEIIEKERGKKLDPKITDVFLNMIKNGEIKEEEMF